MDLPSLRLRVRDLLQPSNILAAIKSAFVATKILYFRAWRRWNKPGFKSSLFGTIGWALLAIFYGLLVGAATVLLPPMAPVAMVALTAPILFWVLPDLPSFPAKALRRAFFIAVIIQLSIPSYYAVQITGIPWISLRRLSAVALILLTLYAISVSHEERKALSKTLSNQFWLSLCIIGYLFMAFISIFFSAQPTQSITQLVEVFLSWYLTFFACLLVIRSEKDVVVVYRTIAWLALFNSALGVLDFITQHNWAVEIIPKPLLMQMMQDNPSFADLVNLNPFRNGMYRASSIFNVPLSFGEFACMVAPIGLYFILHSRKAIDRAFGILVLASSMASLFVSGSRGGFVAFLVAIPLLLGLWVVRHSSLNPRSVVGPLFATVSGMGFAALFSLILTWRKLHNIVLGGGDTAASDDARPEQWRLGLPHILSNPITGHGIGQGAEVVNFRQPGGFLTIDTYALSLLVETGVPGFVFYFGMILVAAGLLIWAYVKDKDPAAEISAPVACSLIAYGVYRLVLSQRENQTLFFIFLGITFVIVQASRERLAKLKKDGAPRKTGTAVTPNGPRTASDPADRRPI